MRHVQFLFIITTWIRKLEKVAKYFTLFYNTSSKQMAKSKITNNARKSHEKKKPFECDICNAGFTENTLFIFFLNALAREKPEYAESHLR